jgi:phosphoesterase RecJ-like protein
VTSLSASEAASIGSGEESLENVVNFLRNIKGVKLALVFREKRDEFGVAARISVRAQPEMRADLFAAEFEGGGHAVAAGCRSRGEFGAATKRVVDRAKEWLDEIHAPVPL